MQDQQAATEAPLFDARTFRTTLGLFATGVTVVAATQEGHLHAMTANALTSLSLDPPLVIFCLARHARMVDELRRADAFTINVLREEQQALSTFFSGRWGDAPPPPFRFLPWEGGPLLDGCVAALGCTVHAWIEGGDHWIVVGRVTALHRGREPRRPLLFFGGTYRHLDTESAPAPDLQEEPIPVQIFYDPW
jgi:flavin reductase (DIM6/NTAB) family NADH-FMN oxidoreductase RutF